MLKLLRILFAAGKLGKVLTTGGTMIVSVLAYALVWGLFFWRPSPLLILMALLAAPQVVKAFRYDPKDPENARYYGVSTAKRLEYGAWYLGLAAFLAIMSHELHETLSARGR